MGHEREEPTKPEIVTTTVADIPALRKMQAKAWDDTYPNEEVGVSEEWVKGITVEWLTPEKMEESEEFLAKVFDDPQHYHRVAKVDDEVVGFVHMSKVDGQQHLAALYLAKEYQGKGLAQELMADAMSWVDLSEDISLIVAAYNERAIRFYQKYGFELIEGTEGIYKEKMPTIAMLRFGEDIEKVSPGPEGERLIDRELVVGRLQEYGIPIEPEDLDGEDENEVMGIVAGFVETFGEGVDMDDIFPETLPIVKRRRDEDGEPTGILEEGEQNEV